MKNRSAGEIVPAVLDACSSGARILHIMQRVHLSHSQARSYLAELLQLGFITLDASEGTTYTTTPDGLQYLTKKLELCELMA